MSPQVEIIVSDESHHYIFVVNMATCSLELLTSKPKGDSSESVTSMNLVPDKVQIRFYQLLKLKQHEFSKATTNLNQ